MSRFPVLCLEIIAVYMAGWASGGIDSTTTATTTTTYDDNISIPYTQSYKSSGYEYNPRDVYESMTTEFKPILTGTINLPPCIKNLMNCWEMLNPDVLCKYSETRPGQHAQERFDTICMDLRFQCREYTGPKPFPTNMLHRYTMVLDVCGKSKELHEKTWYKYNGNSTLSAGKQ